MDRERVFLMLRTMLMPTSQRQAEYGKIPPSDHWQLAPDPLHLRPPPAAICKLPAANSLRLLVF
jgi:hypothetical protein